MTNTVCLNCSQSLQHSLSWICVASMPLNWNVLSTCCLMYVTEEEKLSNCKESRAEMEYYVNFMAEHTPELYISLCSRKTRKFRTTTEKVLNKLKAEFYSSIRRFLIFTSPPLSSFMYACWTFHESTEEKKSWKVISFIVVVYNLLIKKSLPLLSEH